MLSYKETATVPIRLIRTGSRHTVIHKLSLILTEPGKDKPWKLHTHINLTKLHYRNIVDRGNLNGLKFIYFAFHNVYVFICSAERSSGRRGGDSTELGTSVNSAITPAVVENRPILVRFQSIEYSKTCVREPLSRLTLNSGWYWKSCLSYKGTCHVILLEKLHDMYLYKTTTFSHQQLRSISKVAVLHRFYCKYEMPKMEK